MKSAPSVSDNAIQILVSEFLELLPESTKRLVQLASIPNAINHELLQKMSGEEIDAASTLETLQTYYFLTKVEGGWYSFSPPIREYLRRKWDQMERAEEFHNANRKAIIYFEDLAERTNLPGKYVFQREVLYHRLREEVNAGLEYMEDIFERACDQRQIGVAQNFSIQLNLALSELSPSALPYASYYELRLDFLLNRRKNLEGNLETLIERTSDPLLKARVGILLGQVLLAQYEWKKSADILKSSLVALDGLGARRYAARAMLALGDVYLDLVENCGGVQFESSKPFGKWNRFLTDVIFVPFLILDWLKRKIRFMPGWIYFSGNYQDWILNYLLQMAGRWYHRAWWLAEKVNDDVTSLKSLFGQANVAIQQRREAKARQMYDMLVHLPAVHASNYRLAQVLYGRGQVALLANRLSQARQDLQKALEIFHSFADVGKIAAVAQTLGTAYHRLADYESAAQAFLESYQASREAQDPLSQTQIAGELEQLVEEQKISDPLEQQVRQALSSLQEKHYLARFPFDLLRRFRTLAYWVSLPLSYALTLFIGVMTSLALIAIESSILDLSSTGSLSQSGIVFLLFVGVLPIFLAFWITEVIYALVGQTWVFIAGHRSLNTLGEQPDRVILTPEELIVERHGLNEPVQIAWNEIQKLISADYRLWKRPIFLLSRQGIVTGKQTMILNGITSGYMQLQAELMNRTSSVAAQINANLVVLAHRSTYIVILLAMLHAQLLVSVGQIDVTVDDMRLFLAPWLIFFIVDLIMVCPPLFLWRIYLQRRFFERQLAMRPRVFRSVLRLSAAIFLSILAILWLLFSPSLAVGEDETSQSLNPSHQPLGLNSSVIAAPMNSGIPEEHAGSKNDVSGRIQSIKVTWWNKSDELFFSYDSRGRGSSPKG